MILREEVHPCLGVQPSKPLLTVKGLPTESLILHSNNIISVKCNFHWHLKFFGKAIEMA
jgi:hypothetical protein